jgi:hypothetical protein
VYCAGDQPGELSGTAEWDEYTEGAEEGEEVVRCHRVEGSVVPGVYGQQLLLLSGLHHATSSDMPSLTVTTRSEKFTAGTSC